MFKKNDPLVQSVQKVMMENERRRQVEAKLCEELGIYSRKQLPREHQANYDALLEQRINEGAEGSTPTTPKEKALAKLHGNPNKITHGDVLKGRGVIPEAELAAPEAGPKGPAGSKAGAAKKMMKEDELEEAKYSAKAARAGEDIGKPGKNFEKIAKKAGERYGSEERGKKVAGAILAKIRAKHMKEEEGEETREGGAVVDTKTNKPVVSSTASKAEGPSQSEREALTNKIKQMKEAMLSGPETGPRKTPGSNQMCESGEMGPDKNAKKKEAKTYRHKTSEKEIKTTKDPGSEWELVKEEQIAEKAPPGAKFERMVKHIKKGYEKGGLSKKEKSIAYATAWKAKNKEEMKEGLTLDSVMEEIKKKLGEKKMKDIEESDISDLMAKGKEQHAQATTPPVNVDKEITAAANVPSKPDVGTGDIAKQMAPNERTPAAQSFGDEPRRADADKILAKPEPAKPASTQQDRENQQLAATAKRDQENAAAFPADKIAQVKQQEKPSTPAAPASAPKPTPAAKPAAAPAARPASSAPAAAPKPAAPTPPSSGGDLESASSFFQQDRARQEAGKVSGPYNPANRPAARPMARPAARPAKAGGLRESLESTIRNMIKD